MLRAKPRFGGAFFAADREMHATSEIAYDRGQSDGVKKKEAGDGEG